MLITARLRLEDERHQPRASGRQSGHRRGERTRRRLQEGVAQNQARAPPPRQARRRAKAQARLQRRAGKLQAGVPRQQDRIYNEHKPVPRPKAIKMAGQAGYREAMRRLAKEPPPDLITVEASRYALLQAAGLKNNGNSLRQFPDALERLCRPIGDMPPLLRSWKFVDTGKVQLQVDGEWLQPPFTAVTVPLPIKSRPRWRYTCC